MGVAGGRGVLFVRSSVCECMVGRLVSCFDSSGCSWYYC